MSIQPALPDNTTSIDAIDYRKQEIAIELRNVYHTYDNKFSNLLLRNKTERHVPTTAISSAVKYSKHSSSLSSSEPTSANLNRAADSNNNPFFANVQTSSPFHPFNSETEPHTLFPSTPPVHNALPISGQSNGSMVRFENLPPKLHIAESAFDGSSMVAPPTPGVQATPSLELPPGIRHSSKLILNNCNVTIPRGCIYGLLGPSGCGKTTLLKCITGFLKPTYGRVRVFSSIPWSGVGKIPGPDLGYMPQDYSLHEDLTIAEMLTYFGRIFQLPSNVIQKRIPELIDLLNLPNKNQLIGNLSGGQKRRASFVCSIIHMPQLLILDEPTVGCDPLLRQRIWNLLVRFAQDYRMTIIITTHYIEEARLSHLVGFMKKGYLMAENTPDALYTGYETRSLEQIFYRLCVNEKMRKSSTIKRNSTAGKTLKKTQSQLQRSLSQSQAEREKNFYFHDFEVGEENRTRNAFNQPYRAEPETFLQRSKKWMAHLCALNIKNAIQMIRKPEVVVAQFVIPLIVVMFFCVCIGSLPRDIPIGVLNQEQCDAKAPSSLPLSSHLNQNDSSRSVTTLPPPLDIGLKNESNYSETNDGHSFDPNDLCLSEDLLKSLNSYALKQIRFKDYKKAVEEVRAGRLLGILHLKPQFSEALIDKLNFDNDSGLVANSLITFEGDVSNHLLLNMFSLLFYEGYLKFVQYALIKLNMNPLLGRLPVSLGGFLFGKYEESDYSGINAYAGPGLLMIIVYSVAFALTGLALLIDKSNGMFERNRVAGVQSSPMLVSLVIVNMSLFAFGLFVLLLVAIHLFDIPLNGSMATAYGLLLLHALAGLANGLLLSSVLNSISEYAILGNGILLFLFILSGAMWSVESMPFYVRWLAHWLPATQPIESLRSILVRGLHITEAPVYKGYLVSIVWSTAMLIASKYLFDAHV